jgi:hypothetical protein
MRKFLLVVTAAALGIIGLAQPAAADPPTREDLDVTDTAVLTDICSFPITVDLRQTGRVTVFTDRNGNTTRVEVHAVEQDVFTANGKTLVGLPYTYNIHVLFDRDTGEVTHSYATGVVSRVQLPGGDLFLTAGRLDFIAHPDAAFLLQPDVGTQGNLQGFCAALAP